MKNIHKIVKEFFITSNEEIKTGDWVLFESTNAIRKAVDSTFANGVNNIRIYADKKVFKIIMTTDVELIKDNVQPVPDEFLEWFSQNPNCEEVEVERLEDGQYVDRLADGSVILGIYENYKIIIPTQKHLETLKDL